MNRRLLQAGIALALCLRSAGAADASQFDILQDKTRDLVLIADGSSNLVLRLNLNEGCRLDQVIVRGRQVAAPETGICSGIRTSNQWFTTRATGTRPKATIRRNTLTVRDICYHGGDVEVRETWVFEPRAEGIQWEIARDYLSDGTLEDTFFPGWDFQDMNTWTGGLLDTGGVAWNKYLETTNATYGAHAGAVAFWNVGAGDCLRVTSGGRGSRSLHSSGAAAPQTAVRFSRQPSGAETVAFSVTDVELQPKHALRRYHSSLQDLWAPFQVKRGRITATYLLEAKGYDAICQRGTFQGLNGRSIGELLNTIARYGVIDRRVLGANGWRSGYACLHEQWFAQMGIAIDDPDYIANCAATFDFERDYAVLPDGRVKSRWCYDAGDAMPGSYGPQGFYEAQWGYLLDSQPCFVLCVAELFDLNGDRTWLRGQKAPCERALDFLLRRDSDGDGLIEMMTDSHAQEKGSDWIDVIWAAHENGLVNAELYYALIRWAEAEEAIGDEAQGGYYRSRAAKLKVAFSRTTAEGGFWDPQNQWYVYWRDRDDSIHGNNLVTPVNFAAIAYGLCDEPARRQAVLRRIEQEMQHERLFFWPLNVFPYQPEEGRAGNFPFPNYENGDIFLSWGELGVRAYAEADPAVAVKYIKNLLDRYEVDGLSFQRYERNSQRGAGDDILAGNCMAIVGLYRDIYGIQPRHNRLFLDPHLTPDLDGTQLRYRLRNQNWQVDLSTSSHRLAVEDFAVRGVSPFGLSVAGNTADFFLPGHEKPGVSFVRSRRVPVEIQVEDWPADGARSRCWVETADRDSALRHIVCDLQPLQRYTLVHDGQKRESLRANASGRLQFESKLRRGIPQHFNLVPEPGRNAAHPAAGCSRLPAGGQDQVATANRY